MRYVSKAAASPAVRGENLARLTELVPIQRPEGFRIAAKFASLELTVQASQDVQHERDRMNRLWEQRLERARYEAERAERQYNVVEPENRLVARSLERRWEEALQQERQLQEEHD